MFSFAGDTVLDPFAGTGTTALAALRAGRNSISVEIEPKYVAMVRDRTMDRYAATSQDADPVLAEKFERVSSAAGNVAGIMAWLEKTDPAAS